MFADTFIPSTNFMIKSKDELFPFLYFHERSIFWQQNPASGNRKMLEIGISYNINITSNLRAYHIKSISILSITVSYFTSCWPS